MGSGAKRIITAIVGIPLVIGPMYAGGIWFILFIALVVAAGQFELYKIQSKKSWSPASILGIAAGILIVLRSVIDPFQSILIALLITLFLMVILWGGNGDPLSRVGEILSGLVYPALFLSFLPIMRNGMEVIVGARDAFGITLMMFVLIWVCDSAAYYSGRAFGETPLAPTISPKKTWEGSIGGVAGAMAAVVGAKYFLFPILTWTDVVAFGLIAGVIGQLGDLVESAIKRSVNVKDSGNLLPGHGGVLDRFDSLTLATPAYYLYLVTCTTYL
ncbi:MAG: phosphatidate cytidylyltransferase [Bacteroidetes bacterium]|nr:MAG: phosphatidate cytidylyltransferase [Bacteroidota bacterium]